MHVVIHIYEASGADRAILPFRLESGQDQLFGMNFDLAYLGLVEECTLAAPVAFAFSAAAAAFT